MSYLSHNDLITLLPELKMTASIPDQPFNESQVKVCSIDLRCDRIFWEQRKLSGAIDLGSATLMETSPRRHWRRREIKLQHSLKLQPRQMVLGRTYEHFRIPPGYAGKITGRSSYARLGIEISCTCDLINPGWEGHVPLEIINNSASSILIYPLLPLAQLFLIPLSSPADENYANRTKFKSKYINDDGGPSYWWRDALVERLYNNYLSYRVDLEAIDRLKKSIDKLDDEGVFRLENFIRKRSLGEITNVDDLISSFVKSEKKAKLKYQALSGLRKTFATIFLPLSLGVIYYSSSLSCIHYIVFGVTILLGIYCLISWIYTKGDEPLFLTEDS